MDNEAKLPIGIHKLSAVQYYENKSDYSWHNCKGYYVVIDDVVYAFEYNPDDGYRSWGTVFIVDNMSIDNIEKKNKFIPQDVMIEHITRDKYYDSVDYYEIKNPNTAEVILKIGTDRSDSYYPMAIFEFDKKALKNNMKLEEPKSDTNESVQVGYVDIVRQTWQERYDMYMKHTKEELASMLAESAKYTNPNRCAEFAPKKPQVMESSALNVDGKFLLAQKVYTVNNTLDVSAFTYVSID